MTPAPKHPVLFAALAAALTCALAATGEDAARQMLDKSAAELSATLALRKLSAGIALRPVRDAALFDAMAADPARYADPAKAEESLARFFAGEVSADFSRDAVKVLARLSGEKTPDEVFDGAFIDAATNAPEAEVEGYVAKNYKEAFKSARKRVCGEQAKRIASKIRPLESEIDEVPRDQLAKTLAERVAANQGEPVFQENMKYISDAIVKPMLEDAYNQRDFQNSLARTCAPAGHAPSAIAADILRRLDEAIARQKTSADEPDSVYGLFPSVRDKTVPEAAEARAAEIADRVAAATDVSLDIDALAAAIAQNPKAHHTLADSRKLLEPGLAQKLVADATQKLMADAPESEKKEFGEFATRHFAAKPVADALDARVSKELDARLHPLRDAFAEIQYKEFFPELQGRAWWPQADLVDDAAENNDFRKTLAQWTELSGLAQFAQVKAGAPLLEETEALLDKGVVTAFEPGEGARTAQHELADALFDKVRAAVKTDGKLPELAKIIETYTAMVQGEWKSRHDALQPDGVRDAGLYAGLFKSTLRKIELLAKSMMEAPEEKAEPEPEPDPEPPEETPPPPEELEEIEMNCAIVFTRAHEDIEVEVKIDGNRAGLFTCPYAPTAYRKNQVEFTGKAAKAVSDVIGEATKKNRVALTVTLDVRDPLVYYSAVSDVSWLLKGSIEALGEYITKFDLSESR